ncbi:MAG: hypothetical protein M3Q13_00355 [Pseudomonadota bacterium]|nr:hypothetical protein [Pseudomonadota bacterium]MDQ3228176.1 hypothetical protein [Pseudomonadota bacterium]
MPDNNLMAIASVSDDSAVNRLFDIIAEGNPNSQEFMVLDAIVYQRLMQNYEHGVELSRSLDPAQAA